MKIGFELYGYCLSLFILLEEGKLSDRQFTRDMPMPFYDLYGTFCQLVCALVVWCLGVLVFCVRTLQINR